MSTWLKIIISSVFLLNTFSSLSQGHYVTVYEIEKIDSNLIVMIDYHLDSVDIEKKDSCTILEIHISSDIGKAFTSEAVFDSAYKINAFPGHYSDAGYRILIRSNCDFNEICVGSKNKIHYSQYRGKEIIIHSDLILIMPENGKTKELYFCDIEDGQSFFDHKVSFYIFRGYSLIEVEYNWIWSR